MGFPRWCSLVSKLPARTFLIPSDCLDVSAVMIRKTLRIRARAESLAPLLPTLLGPGPTPSSPCPGPWAPVEGSELGEAGQQLRSWVQAQGERRLRSRGGALCRWAGRGVLRGALGAPLSSPSALALRRGVLLAVRSGLLIPGDKHSSWRSSGEKRWGVRRMRRGTYAVSRLAPKWRGRTHGPAERFPRGSRGCDVRTRDGAAGVASAQGVHQGWRLQDGSAGGWRLCRGWRLCAMVWQGVASPPALSAPGPRGRLGRHPRAAVTAPG